jgi:hypothetical protein
MSATVVALVVTGVVVVALAFYLLWVVVLLRRLVDTLGKIQFGVGAIAHRAEPLASVVDDLNTDLSGVADALASLVSDLEGRSHTGVA